MNRKIRPLLAVALYSLTANMLVTVVPFFAIRIGGSELLIALSIGFFFTFYGIGCLISSEKITRYATYITAAACMIAGLATFSIIFILKAEDATNLKYLLILIMSIMGLLQSQFFPVMMNKVTSGYTDKALAKQITLYNYSWSLTFFIVPFLGGLLLEKSYILTTAIIGTLYIIVSLLILEKSDTSAKIVNKREITQPTTKQDNIKIISRISLFLLALIFICYKTNLSVFMTEKLGKSEKDYGLINTLINFATVLAFFLLEKFTAWHGKKRLLILSQFLLVPALLLIPFSENFRFPMLILSISTILTGLVYGFVYTSNQFYTINNSRNTRRATSMHEFIISLGFITGSATTILTEKISFQSFYIIISVVISIFIIIEFFTKRVTEYK
ncbi:MAG: MFS transporter [Spirochaetales bacterium]|nr:MFS transporter [Spirochaetales bacterium]